MLCRNSCMPSGASRRAREGKVTDMLKISTPRRTVLMLLPLLTALVLTVVGIAACSQSGSQQEPMPPVASETVVVTPSSSVPNDDPSIRGFITRITNSAESIEVLVEYFAEDENNPRYPYDKVLIKLDENTAVDSDNGTIITTSSLSVGSTVEVWFSEPSAESYPVLAYGQAVRLITSGDAMDGMRGIPKLTVIGSSKSLAGMVKVNWPLRNYDYETTLREMLGRMRGAYITAAPGSTLTLSFSTQPQNITAAWSGVKTALSRQNELAVSENREIVIPEDAKGELFIRVEGEWPNGSVTYGFSVSIVEQN